MGSSASSCLGCCILSTERSAICSIRCNPRCSSGRSTVCGSRHRPGRLQLLRGGRAARPLPALEHFHGERANELSAWQVVWWATCVEAEGSECSRNPDAAGAGQALSVSSRLLLIGRHGAHTDCSAIAAAGAAGSRGPWLGSRVA